MTHITTRTAYALAVAFALTACNGEDTAQQVAETIASVMLVGVSVTDLAVTQEQLGRVIVTGYAVTVSQKVSMAEPSNKQ